MKKTNGLMTRRRAALVALGTAAMLAAGCGGPSAESVTGGKVKVDSSGKNVEISDGKGNSVKTGSLPADFPKDIPLPDDYEVSASAGAGGTGAGSVVTLTTAMSIEEATKLYQDGLDEKGWTVQQHALTPTGGAVTATKGSDNLSVAVAKNPNGAGTAVALTVVSS